MLAPKVLQNFQRRVLGGLLCIGAAIVWAPVAARAHFVLVAPESWMSQDANGSPLKVGPCGDEGGGTPTGVVTPFHPGETIAVTINEVIAHPGHYRVALAVNDRSELPPEPLVTPSVDGDPCSSAAIQDPPVFPVLADHMLPHTQEFSEPQTFTVTLPDVTCSKCTLQVLEFMSHHGAPCFYHHCADISIQGEPVATPTPLPTASPTPTAPPAAACAAIALPRLRIGRLLSPPGDDTLRFYGSLTLPAPVTPALNPLADGVRLLIDDAAGTVLDVTIPGGTGWAVNRTATRWTYRNRKAMPPGGISFIVVRDRSAATPGLVRFGVRGKAASVPVAAADLPAAARVILVPPGGQCGQATFATCAFNRRGSVLQCK